MAEGGYDPTTENETPWEDHGIDHDDDDEEYTTPRSSPMKPPPPEEIEMSQLPREQNGWRRQQEQQAAWLDLKDMYPQANKETLEVSYVKVPGKEPRLSIKMAGSMRAYWLFEPNLFGRWRGKSRSSSRDQNLSWKVNRRTNKRLQTTESQERSNTGCKTETKEATRAKG